MKKDRVQTKFLDTLREIPIVEIACKRTGISRNSVYRWRKEDDYFSYLMNKALEEGEGALNDLAESQLLSLIKEKHFQSIRFWLTNRHSKFKKPDPAIEQKDNFDTDEVIEDLGLTSVDFLEENRIATAKKISDYLTEKSSR